MGFFTFYDSIVKLPEINSNEKILLNKIIALSVTTTCFASNPYLEDELGLSEKQIRLALKNLVDRGYITSQFEYFEGSKKIKKRYIHLTEKTKELIGKKIKKSKKIEKQKEPEPTPIPKEEIDVSPIKKGVATFIGKLLNQGIAFSSIETSKMIEMCEHLQINPMDYYVRSSYLQGNTNLQPTRRMFSKLDTWEKMKLGDYDDKKDKIKTDKKIDVPVGGKNIYEW